MIQEQYCFVDYDFISKPEEGLVYVVKEDATIRLLCPCGCGDLIQLSMVEDQRPRWKVENNSIVPSIRRVIGCLSHFTITNRIVKFH